MTDLTTPSLRPLTGPCAARHCEAPAVYGPEAGPEAAEAERLCDRLNARLGLDRRAWTALAERSGLRGDHSLH